MKRMNPQIAQTKEIKTKAFNEPALAGGSIKPRVEHSATLGRARQSLSARETGGRGWRKFCRPPSRASDLRVL